MHSEELVNFVRSRLREQRVRLQNEIHSRQISLRLIGEAMAQSGEFEVAEYPAGVKTAVWTNGIAIDVTDADSEPPEPSDGDSVDDRPVSPSPDAADESNGGESVSDPEESPESESI